MKKSHLNSLPSGNNSEALLNNLSLLRLFTACWILLASSITFAAEPQTLRMCITPAMTRGQYAALEAWRAYLQARLGRKFEFNFRNNYGECTDLMKRKELDFAWLSAPAYLESSAHANLLVTPLYQGRPFERAYLIVPAADRTTQSLEDLKGKIFAYADHDSNTGYLDPRLKLSRAGHEPDQFFKKTFITGDHQKTVAAVAVGLADGGSVSGFVWETLTLARPDIGRQTRVVAKSDEYGFPPLVARSSLNKQDYTRMQQVLLRMSTDSAGIKLLKQLNLDGFVLANKKHYRSVYLTMKDAGGL